MKFRTVKDARMFLVDIDRYDLVESVIDVQYKPSKSLVELFLKKRRGLVGLLRDEPRKDFRKSQDAKGMWRTNRHEMMKGIKRFHASTYGKRFHRELGRFLATREDFNDDILFNVTESCKALSSLVTQSLIEFEYYIPLSEEIAYWHLVEVIVPTIDGVKSRILQGKFEISSFEEDVLFTLVEASASITALASKYGKTVDEVEILWNKAKQIVKNEYNKTEDDEGFWALVVGTTKKSLGAKG